TACRETETLDLSGGQDTTSTAQAKNTILEEVTGVRCVNCPEAHELAKQIATDHPGRVELVSIHTGFFAVPYGFSNENFKIAQGTSIESYLGGPLSYPLASVDRFLPAGQSDLLLDKAFWGGLAAQRVEDSLRVEIDLANSYNAATRTLNVTLSAEYLFDIGDAQKINVLLTESGIVDPQLTPDGVDTFYVHDNVLRAVLTEATGDAVTETTTSGTALQRTYSFTLPSGLVAENCRVIAFIAKETADSKEVLQVVGKNVIE
ncbi:MAG TPA: Omp28-related outer membrane protein, partial [Chitinophagales bacterium]|nr:Omp28-related outer membrane protein [Chitinophagales bacterium]